MKAPVFLPADILLPAEGIDLGKWAVVACDQFTSEPEYWRKADTLVADAPSTLRMILPEVHLEAEDVEERIEAIHAAMAQYRQTLLQRPVRGFVYVERHISSGVRQGLVGCVDLEEYSYQKSDTPRIRPSENTVVERIPPRLAVRRGASLESPHILMLCDDADGTVVEPIAARKDTLQLLYDAELMLEGGRIRGWAVTEQADIDAVLAALAALEDEKVFAARYGASTPPFPLAVGDGNHSLATAKALWEETKQELSPEEQTDHPARYCLVELENIHCPANDIEPIHRVAFGVDAAALQKALADYAAETGAKLAADDDVDRAGQWFLLISGDETKKIALEQTGEPLAVGAVDAVLALCQRQNPALRVDYIHGEDSVLQLVAAGDAVGILLPPFYKSDLFKGVALGGVLPKKTFSMGHATEKRYYLECRAIL